MLSSGVQIEGLQKSNGPAAPRKVVYGNRKKKQLSSTKDTESSVADDRSQPDARTGTPTPDTRSPVVQSPELPPPSAVDDVKDAWDAESDKEESAEQKASVESDWDASSDDENEANGAGKSDPSDRPGFCSDDWLTFAK